MAIENNNEPLRQQTAALELSLAQTQAALAQALRASAQKDDLLVTLSHELRSPLSAVLGWVHILRRGVKTPDELAKGLDIIERNAKLQSRLIDDLMDTTRIAEGKVRLNVQPVDPIVFIEAALEAARPAAEAKQLRIVRLLAPSVGALPGDTARLQQIMGNLLSNAIKFTPRGGSIQVVLKRVDAFAEITVADDGIGIKPDFIGRVFERFKQADAPMAREHGGLGLGLCVVKSLVELHGGTVHANSAGEGQGAAFTVRLPLPD